MALVNTTKPSTTLANASKVASFETWDSIATTWDTETRTWDDMLSLMDNASKPTASITNLTKPA